MKKWRKEASEVKLTDDEKAMLQGSEGKARQKAMELLVRYGEALGAERLIATNNVCGYMMATSPFARDFAAKYGGLDAALSEFNLDSSETIEFPQVKVFSCQLETSLDPQYWELQGATKDLYEAHIANEAFNVGIGVNQLCTCTPYLVGNVPVKGEHCAWMESSAVVYINSVLGARTNVEGGESTTAAMLTGKIPDWGFHLDQNRLGTHLIHVEWEVESVLDWGLLGYYAGQMVGEKIPVFHGIRHLPNMIRLKHLGAASASSGGVEMFHIPGITAEARTLDEAFGGKKAVDVLRFGKAERMLAYDKINACAHDSAVDFIMLGCPHAAMEELWEICRQLAGKKVNSGTSLWIFTPRAIKDMADRNGYTQIISEAGAVLMSDTCPALGQFMPKGTKVGATNSAKQAHYLPAILGIQCWFGSTADCIQAAITGTWRGELK
jgi:hypothetical protein